MADFYKSTHDGATVDSEITYVKQTVRKKLPLHDEQIDNLQRTKANDTDVVKKEDRNKPGGYVCLDKDGKIDPSFFDASGGGADGASAYEIAVEHGFEGTEEEWLESLNGKDGANGKDGVDGKDGVNGSDGYTPRKGIDYYTEEDKKEIQCFIDNSIKSERNVFNPLYAPAFVDEAENDEELVVADAVKDTPIALSVYGACTESLPEGVTEKSLDSPAIITGVGESGSVTVMVTDSEGVDTEIEIPLDSPFYGIRHPETGEWLARDEIRVENGKVTLTRNVQKYEVDSTGNGYIAVIAHGGAASAGGSVFAVGSTGVSLKPGSVEVFSVMSPQLKTARTYAVMSSLRCGSQGNYDRHFILTLPDAVTGIVAGDTATQKKEKFIAWLSEYNATSDIPLTIYAICQPTETDITDTDAGKLLLALSASGNMAVKTNENSPVGMRYHRDVKSAYEELKNAMIAMGGTI